MRLLYAVVEAPEPIGPVHIASDGRSLVALDFGARDGRFGRVLARRYGPDMTLADREDPQGFAAATRAYLAGRLDAFDGVPVDGGGTPFQRRVWALLRAIPPGRTRTYGALAAELGQPGASRAVGLANGRNPVNLAVPCHRVIGRAGDLTGYGGGLARKQWLLRHEQGGDDPQAALPFRPEPASRAGAGRQPARLEGAGGGHGHAVGGAQVAQGPG